MAVDLVPHRCATRIAARKSNVTPQGESNVEGVVSISSGAFSDPHAAHHGDVAEYPVLTAGCNYGTQLRDANETAGRNC